MSSFASITITGVLTVCNVMMVNMMKLMNKIAITIIVKSIKFAGESMMKVEVLEASPQTFVSPISQSSCSLWSLYLKKKKLYFQNDINIYWIITYYGHTMGNYQTKFILIFLLTVTILPSPSWSAQAHDTWKCWRGNVASSDRALLAILSNAT